MCWDPGWQVQQKRRKSSNARWRDVDSDQRGSQALRSIEARRSPSSHHSVVSNTIGEACPTSGVGGHARRQAGHGRAGTVGRTARFVPPFRRAVGLTSELAIDGAPMATSATAAAIAARKQGATPASEDSGHSHRLLESAQPLKDRVRRSAAVQWSRVVTLGRAMPFECDPWASRSDRCEIFP